MVIRESIQQEANILQLSEVLDVKSRTVFQDAIRKGQDSGIKCLILDFQDVHF